MSLNKSKPPPASQQKRLAWPFGEYWHTPLGSFYRDLSHRLTIYLLVGVSCMVITYLTAIVLYGTAWLVSDLAHITAYAFHLALVFAGSLAVVDLVISRGRNRKWAYAKRTVGRQWLVMFIGFAAAYLLFRTTFHKLTEFYSLWLFGYDRILPEGPAQFLPELLFFFVFWLFMTLLIIQFALWSQRTASQASAVVAEAEAPLSQGGQETAQPADAFLILEQPNQDLTVPLAEITHVTVEDHYCRLFRHDGNKVESHIFRMPLRKLEQEFPVSQFVRIHRSYIVNLEHVLGWCVVGGQRRLVMDHDIGDLPISRARFSAIKPKTTYLKRRQGGPWPTPAYEDNSSG